MNGLIPPIAIPVGSRAIVASAFGGDDARLAFRETLTSISGFRTVDLYSSGRAALAALLAECKRTTRTEVAVPAYTCWSVPAAIVSAGLSVRLVDMDPATLDFDVASLGRAVSGSLAAIVVAHLFAAHADVDAVVELARAKDPSLMVVDDRAQAWLGARPSPASAVLLSFGRGKPLPLGGGGAVLHHGPSLAPAAAGTSRGFVDGLVFAATSLLAQPRPYGLLEGVPFLRIGSTRYDPTFPRGDGLHGWQARLGSHMFDPLLDWTERRTANARRLATRVDALAGWSVAPPARCEGPLRLPILAPSRGARDAAIASLRRQGVGSSPMYPGTLADIPALRPRIANPGESLRGATEVAARLLTLPVYPTLSPRQVDGIATAFERAAANAGR